MATESQMTDYALFFRAKQLSVWHPDIMMVIRHACDVDGICYDKGGVRLREHFRIDERIRDDN